MAWMRQTLTRRHQESASSSSIYTICHLISNWLPIAIFHETLTISYKFIILCNTAKIAIHKYISIHNTNVQHSSIRSITVQEIPMKPLAQSSRRWMTVYETKKERARSRTATQDQRTLLFWSLYTCLPCFDPYRRYSAIFGLTRYRSPAAIYTLDADTKFHVASLLRNGWVYYILWRRIFRLIHNILPLKINLLILP